MKKIQSSIFEGRIIANALAVVVCEARLLDQEIILRASVNGNTVSFKLPLDSVGLRIVTHVRTNLQVQLIKCVEQLLSESAKQPHLKKIRTETKFESTRIGFIRRCLDVIANLRAENRAVTQRAVAERLYGIGPSSGGSYRDAQFSQDLRRKKVSFGKLKQAGKRYQELTPDELLEVLKKT